jgi:hypothetical protein
METSLESCRSRAPQPGAMAPMLGQEKKSGQRVIPKKEIYFTFIPLVEMHVEYE